MLSKLLKPLVHLQVEPTLSIEAAATESGYVDAGAFSKACLGLLGLSPRRVRTYLGWEWILDTFLRRHRR
jgi:hypothetical protein